MSSQDQINALGGYCTSQIAQINGRFNLLNAYCDGLQQQVENLDKVTVKTGLTYYDQTDLTRGGKNAQVFEFEEVADLTAIDFFALGGIDDDCCGGW